MAHAERRHYPDQRARHRTMEMRFGECQRHVVCVLPGVMTRCSGFGLWFLW
jgi:hypothetical protein